jgi:hypothetical protein
MHHAADRGSYDAVQDRDVSYLEADGKSRKVTVIPDSAEYSQATFKGRPAHCGVRLKWQEGTPSGIG